MIAMIVFGMGLIVKLTKRIGLNRVIVFNLYLRGRDQKMPMKWCPKCKKIAEKVNRVFSVVSKWDEIEEDYMYDSEDLYNAELFDKCLECDTELEELPYVKGAEDSKAI